jgi:hypothetical protein
MRYRIDFLAAAIACLLTLVQSEPARASLCNADEEVLFTCKSGPTKIISVCASPNSTAATGHLVYRFGREKQKPSLTYPIEPIPPQDAFKFAQSCSAKGCAEQLAFSVGKFKYTVYSDHFGGVADPAQDAGVFVEEDGRKVADIRCTYPLAPMDMYRIGTPLDHVQANTRFLGLPVGEPKILGPGAHGGVSIPEVRCRPQAAARLCPLRG